MERLARPTMIDRVSKTLRRFLLGQVPGLTSESIKMTTLHSDDSDAQEVVFPPNKLLIGLYRIAEEPFLRNRAPVPITNGYRQPDFSVTLSYLITDTSDNAEQIQERLSGVLAAFSTVPELKHEHLDPELARRVESLLVRLNPLDLDQMNQLWTALNHGMRLSLYYDVQVAPIPATRSAITPPVTELRIGGVAPGRRVGEEDE
jgi:hypothetical protein